MNNFILSTDSYKIGHWNMLPEGTTEVYSYAECRAGGDYGRPVFFGLQYILKRYLTGVVVTQDMLDEARVVVAAHLGNENALNIAGWQRIIDVHGGKLPLEIKAVPEGLPIDLGNVLFTIRNTDPECPWLTNFVESILMKFWYPTTVATRSKFIVDNIRRQCDKTSENPHAWKYMLHDFGYRSASSEEAAAIGGAAHLVNGFGTDTVPALKLLHDYYGAGYGTIGYSVPATEHSVATAFGPVDGEFEYVREMMRRYPNGILSLVADSYGIERFVNEVVFGLRDEIIARFENGDPNAINRVVIRPDSPRTPEDNPEKQVIWLHNRLSSIFGTTLNRRGYRVLHPAIGVLYGDGLSSHEIDDIYDGLVFQGYSVENCVVGQGGGLLQKLNRDTLRVAIKCSKQVRNGEPVDVRKNPSDQTKASKAGELVLLRGGRRFLTEKKNQTNENDDVLEPVFLNGELLRDMTLEDVRKNSGFSSTNP